MGFTDIVDFIDQIMTSALAPLLLFIVITIMALVKIKKKNSKISLLKTDDRFIDAKFFPMHLKVPMAISPSGYIGFVLPENPLPVVMHIKNVKRIVLYSAQTSLADRNKKEHDGRLFNKLTLKMEPVLQLRTKKINLLLIDTNDAGCDIPIFGSTLRRATRINPIQQITIQEFLCALEEMEKSFAPKASLPAS